LYGPIFVQWVAVPPENLSRQTPSLPNADPRAGRPQRGGHKSNFLADRSLAASGASV
jgi:hypothetical protein